jgi:uncharacterized protein involved in outer membrane biogenesis
VLGRILMTLGGLLVAALFAALFIPYFVDWSEFRRDFEDQASRILGKKVVVHGTVEARLLPFPSVTLNDVRAGTDANGEPILQAARFSMDAELAPFLSGEARIFDMRIEEPKARIRLLSDGTLEWNRGSRSQIPANAIVLESVKIERGDIEFIDEQTGRNRHLTDLNMQLSARDLFGPWRADGEAKIDGQAGKFTLSTGAPDAQNGRLALRLKLMPQDYPIDFDLDGALTVRDGKPLYAGNFAMLLRKSEGEKADENPSLLSNPRTRGEFELANDRIRIPTYRTELGTADSPYVVTGEATLDTGAKPEFLLTADGQQIDVGRLVVPRNQAGKTDRVQKLTVKQRVEALADIISRIPVPQVPGKASISLPAIVSDNTNIRDIRLEVRPDGKGWQVVSAVATLPGRTQLEASGAVKFEDGPSFDGSLLVASNQPTGLATWLTGEVDPAIRPLSAAGFSSKVSLTPNRQTFEDLEIAIGAASMLGRFERQITENKAHSIMSLSGNEINLDALRAIASLALGEPVGSSMLEQSVDAHLRADRLNVGGVVAENVDTRFALSGGRITIGNFHAGDVAGAEIKLSGDLSGNLANYNGNAKLEFTARDLGPFSDFLASHLPRHALIGKLQTSAPWYQDTNLVVDLSLSSEKGGVNAAISGTINGSRISSVAKLPDFTGLTDDTELAFEAVLKNASTAILFGQAGFDPLPIDADGEGLLSLKLNGTLGSPFATELNFSTERTRFAMKGEHRLNALNFAEGQSQITLESADFAPYLMMNSIPATDLITGLPLKLSSKLTVDAQRLHLEELKGNLAGNNFAARLERGFEADPLWLGEIGVDYLDLGWLGENTFGGLSDVVSGAYNANALMSPSFAGLKSRISVNAKNFAADAYGMMADMKANVETLDGRITLGDFSANWLAGALTGKLSLSSSEGTGVVSGNFALRGASLLPSTWVLADGSPRASANYDLDLSVESSGKSVAEMIDHAAGSGQLALRQPVLRAFNGAAFQPIVEQADTIEKDINAEKVEPILTGSLWHGETQFSDATIPLTLSNGSLKLQGGKLAASGLSIDLEGAMALEDFSLSGGANVTLDPGVEALTGVSPSFRLPLSGTLFDPEVTADVTELTGFLGLRAFEKERRRVEALQASIQEKQRLRREAALYAERERIRQEKAEAERLRVEELRLQEEARQREEAARLAEEEARKRRLLEEQQRVIEQSQPPQNAPNEADLVPPQERVLRFDLPEVQAQ